MNALARTLCCALLVLTVAAAPAGDSAAPGTIRVWSSPAMQDVVARLRDGFRRHHPNAEIVSTPLGTDVAVAGLYTGRADIALLGREATASEVQAFEWIFRCKPTRVEIMNGSVDVPEKSPALAVFVHRDNPLAQLTLAQLDAIFGYEHRRGPATIRTWGQLGLGGEWAARPIELYGPDATSGTGAFFRHAVLNDSRKLNWERMHELADDRIADALAQDRFGIAVSSLASARPGLKALALARDERGPFAAPTADTVASRSYPLTRIAVALIARLPGSPVAPDVKAFLDYVLSDEGQAIVRKGGYTRLPADVVREQLRSLEVAAPIEAQTSTKIYAQQLADEIIAKHPELLVIAMHFAQPNGSDHVIVASNTGPSGAKATTVEVPLRDTSGATVGALDLVFRGTARSDRAALELDAARIRDGLARRTLNVGNLLDAYPTDPAVATKTHAQKLVDQTMAKHPELLSLAMHVTLPDNSGNVILGSSFGRIGKKADEDDLRVIATGKPSPGVAAGGTRFGVELTLLDASGKTIGALTVAYPYKHGDDEAALLARAEALRDELRTQIDSVEHLVELDP